LIHCCMLLDFSLWIRTTMHGSTNIKSFTASCFAFFSFALLRYSNCIGMVIFNNHLSLLGVSAYSYWFQHQSLSPICPDRTAKGISDM
jgi:hypothetical protein